MLTHSHKKTLKAVTRKLEDKEKQRLTCCSSLSLKKVIRNTVKIPAFSLILDLIVCDTVCLSY